MRALILCNHLEFLLSHRAYLVDIFLEKDSDISVLVGSTRSVSMRANVPDRWYAAGVSFQRTPRWCAHNMVLDLACCFVITLVHCLTRRPNLIHAISPTQNLLAAILSNCFKRTRIILSFGGLGNLYVDTGEREISLVGKNFKKWFRGVFEFILRLSSRNERVDVIVQNIDDFNFVNKILGFKSEQIHLIRGSGVRFDISMKSTMESKELRVIYPGRCVPEKGVREFCHAAKKLKRFYPEWQFVVVGSLDYSNQFSLVDYLSEHNLGDAVVVTGYMCHEETLDLMRRSYIACLPSYREGFPLALAEACMLDCAIVAADVAGCADLLEETGSGLLVRPMDVEDLTANLRVLLDDPRLLKSFCKQGNKWILENCSYQVIKNSHYNIYFQRGALNG